MAAQQQSHVLALVGDSDFERWPADLLPVLPNINDCNGNSQKVRVRVHGHSGATLEHMLPIMKAVLQEETAAAAAASSQIESFTVIFCAGENDIGQGTRLDEILISFRTLLEMMFPPPPQPTATATAATATATTKKQTATKSIAKHLIFLGPKLEPWLEYDTNCRKQYVKLSMAMERACKNHGMTAAASSQEGQQQQNQNKITYVDCLTMFCGESGQQPGATLGGKAVPEKRYFDHDLLHLSREGYQIWKDVTEGLITPAFY